MSGDAASVLISEKLRKLVHSRGTETKLSSEHCIRALFVSRWFDIGCLILEDPSHNIRIELFTQATPLALEHIQQVETMLV